MTNNSTTTPSIVEDLTPATGTVDIELLLDNIDKYISAHAILPKGASAAITLWCLASYNINCFRILPRLAITSPEKRCGKSTVLDLIEAFSHKALITSNMTSATIFRLIDKEQPTLIIDEADTFVANGSSEMTGIINSGHAESRANIARCVGDGNDVKVFSTWAPMVLAAIGSLPSTIMDRSVIITLRRKLSSESSLRIDVSLKKNALNVREDLLRWSLDNTKEIINNHVEPPNLGNDRAVDNWLPIFTIASLVSDAWLKKCEDAYTLLTDHGDEIELSTSLLADIREIFDIHNDDKLPSAELVEKLIEDKDKPWCEHKHGRAISPNNVATILKAYKIKPKSIRIGNKTLRGYELEQFKDAFDRYL